MSNRLMISVAAIALLAGTGLANAQGGMKNESGGAAVQQSAPSGGAAGRESVGPSQTQSTQSDQKSPGAAKSQRAQDNMPGAKSENMSSENTTKSGAKDMKAEGREG